MTSRSSVIDSTARWAAYRMVPPGVSYTPRDFMPTYRFSTRSTRPMPCFPPRALSRASSFAGPSFFPSTVTGIPFSNPTSTYSGRSGAACGDFERTNMSSGGSDHGSSRIPPSKLMCRRFRSLEYGFAAVTGVGMPCFFA
jgi:hypothetical protein